MRKIEQDMNAAVSGQRNWRGGNTAVNLFKALNGDVCGEVTLHGHRIASIYYTGSSGERLTERRIVVDQETLSDWPTVTTCSRLRALGANVNIKQGQPYLNGQLVN